MNCLKCGRTVADGELFCPACSGRGPVPEPDHKVEVHAHPKAEVLLIEEPADSSPAEKRVMRTRRWMGLLLLLCLAAIGLQMYHIRNLDDQLTQAQIAQRAARSAQQELELELEETRELLNTVEEDLAQRDLIIQAYEEYTDIPAEELP